MGHFYNNRYIKHQRQDYIHKISIELIRNNQIIAVESLKVKNMIKNPKLSQSISDVSWGKFVSFLVYKAKMYGRTVIKIDQFYPSSKRCSHCDYKLDNLSLDIRHWECPECRASHDRDINAAVNILAEGLRLLEKESA
jgi:putative transposase